MSATVIDALVVTLGLDPTKFTEGQKKALSDFKRMRDESSATAKELQYRGKQAAEFYTGVKDAALGLFTVLAGNAVVKFGKDVAVTVANTSRMASNLGVAINTLAAFGNMVERNGGQAGEAAAAFNTLTSAAAQYSMYGTIPQQMQVALGMIGSSEEEAGKNPEEVYKKFNVWAQGQTGPQAMMFGSALGFSPAMVNLARKSVAEFNAELEKSKRLEQITDAQGKSAERLQNAWTGVDQAIMNTAKDILTSFSPTLIWMLTAMSSWISKNKDTSKTIGEIGIAIAALVGLSAFSKLASALGLTGVAAVAAAPGAAAAGAVKSPWLMGLLALLYSPSLNEGEDAEVAKMKAGRSRAGGSSKGETLGSSRLDALMATGGYAKGFGEKTRMQILQEELQANPNDPALKREIALSRRNGGSGGGGTSTSETHIGAINIYNPADADDVARNVRVKIQEANKNLAIATQANSGMQ
jgi:hypothetical protein